MTQRVSFISPQLVLRVRASSASSARASMLARTRRCASSSHAISSATAEGVAAERRRSFVSSSPHRSAASPNEWFSYMYLHAPTCATISAIGRAPPGGSQSQSRGSTARTLVRSECQSGPANAASSRYRYSSMAALAMGRLPTRLAPLYLELSFHAVELALPGMASPSHAFRDGCREHLGPKEVGELLDRPSERAFVPQHDAIGDVEAGFLPQRVHMMRELARETFRLEFRRRLRHKRGDRAGVTPDRVSGRPLVAHQYLGRRKREALDDRVAVTHREAALGQRLADPRQLIAELRPERLQLRLHGLAHEPLRVVTHLEGLHVELVADDRRELVLALERAAVAVARIEDRDELWQRRADLRLRGGSRGAAERHDAHRGTHAPLEVVIDPLGADLRVGREMHRRRRATCGLTNEVLVQRLGQERHHRREKTRQGRQRVVQRLVGG